MDPIWLIPPAVLLLGAIPAGLWAARAGAELTALRHDLARWSVVRPVVGEVRAESRRLRQRLDEVRHR